MRERRDLEAHLEGALGPWAVRARDSRGRRYEEGEAAYRGLFQRDRDRIIHCGAFRRLEYKTQVFVSVLEGDHYRNRLTHTMEVTQIGRTVARALGLNEDLVETLALAHDLGHGPFGHSGEDALNDLMRPHGGFNHNIQGLRVVDLVERRYPDFEGLNLLYETREGYTKNLRAPEREALGFAPGEALTLEGQVVQHADEVAYDTHDLEDSLVSKTLTEDSVRTVSLWLQTETEVCAEHPLLREDHRLRWRAVQRRLIAKLVGDLIRETESRLAARGIASLAGVRAAGAELAGFSPEMTQLKTELEAFLHRNFYRSPKVRGHTERWQGRLKELFQAFLQHPELVPPDYRGRVEARGEPLERAICDYLSGMTDRYAERMWETLCRKA